MDFWEAALVELNDRTDAVGDANDFKNAREDADVDTIHDVDVDVEVSPQPRSVQNKENAQNERASATHDPSSCNPKPTTPTGQSFLEMWPFDISSSLSSNTSSQKRAQAAVALPNRYSECPGPDGNHRGTGGKSDGNVKDLEGAHDGKGADVTQDVSNRIPNGHTLHNEDTAKASRMSRDNADEETEHLDRQQTRFLPVPLKSPYGSTQHSLDENVGATASPVKKANAGGDVGDDVVNERRHREKLTKDASSNRGPDMPTEDDADRQKTKSEQNVRMKEEEFAIHRLKIAEMTDVDEIKAKLAHIERLQSQLSGETSAPKLSSDSQSQEDTLDWSKVVKTLRDNEENNAKLAHVEALQSQLSTESSAPRAKKKVSSDSQSREDTLNWSTVVKTLRDVGAGNEASHAAAERVRKEEMHILQRGLGPNQRNSDSSAKMRSKQTLPKHEEEDERSSQTMPSPLQMSQDTRICPDAKDENDQISLTCSSPGLYAVDGLER